MNNDMGMNGKHSMLILDITVSRECLWVCVCRYIRGIFVISTFLLIVTGKYVAGGAE